MGWGISFDLDANGRVYCSDGCKWRATKADYADYPPWPSAQQSVLDYFEHEAHRELDMIRDECPGTAAALKEACDEHIGSALGRYERLSDREKTELHQKKLDELVKNLEHLEAEKKQAYHDYIQCRKDFRAYKPCTQAPKTRAEELQRAITPLRLELEMELSARDYDHFKSALTKAKRDLKLEKLFTLE